MSSLFEIEAIERIHKTNYAADAGAQILPSLHRGLTCSILGGQLHIPDQSTGSALLDRYMAKYRPIQIVDVAQLYCLYITNLTQPMIDTIRSSLASWPPYVGFIPATYSSPMKTWLSTTLMPRYVKVKRQMISAHEDDVSNDENFNYPSWPHEDHDYQALSLQSTCFDLFLGFKIERAVYDRLESDTNIP